MFLSVCSDYRGASWGVSEDSFEVVYWKLRVIDIYLLSSGILCQVEDSCRFEGFVFCEQDLPSDLFITVRNSSHFVTGKFLMSSESANEQWQPLLLGEPKYFIQKLSVALSFTLQYGQVRKSSGIRWLEGNGKVNRQGRTGVHVYVGEWGGEERQGATL